MLSIFAVKVIILVNIYFRPDFRGIMRQTEIPEFGGLIWTANHLLHIFYLGGWAKKVVVHIPPSRCAPLNMYVGKNSNLEFSFC